ncbi:MAG TPA: CHRD domain-containing protein [Allosphingosinicella sp.]|nr:CHRD domain-containing protein [Allosphingosinicella sp.]
MMHKSLGLMPMFLLVAACATGEGMTPADLRASLNGLQEVPGPGDPDGSGTAVVRVNPAGGQVCWTLAVRGLDPASAAHIHRGPAGSAGPPVVTLTTPGADGRSEGCIAVDQALARDMVGRSFDYYVNVHNAAFPAGAIRGQLRGEVRRLRRGA